MSVIDGDDHKVDSNPKPLKQSGYLTNYYKGLDPQCEIRRMDLNNLGVGSFLNINEWVKVKQRRGEELGTFGKYLGKISTFKECNLKIQ